MHECVFCRIGRGEDRSEIIYEDDQVIALMDICPIRPGHAQIMPREHFAYFEDLPEVTVSRINPSGAAPFARDEGALWRAARRLPIHRWGSRARPCSCFAYAPEDRRHVAALHCRREPHVSRPAACPFRRTGRHSRAAPQRAASMNQLVGIVATLRGPLRGARGRVFRT